MDFEKYTERARGFIQSAQTLALREGHQKFTPEHVLKVLLDDEEGLAAGLIKAAGGDSRLALRDTEAALAKMPKVSGAGAGQVYLSPEMARVFEAAQKLATKSNDSFVTAERLLQALAIETSEASKILKNAGNKSQACKVLDISYHTLNAYLNFRPPPAVSQPAVTGQRSEVVS